MIRGVSRGFIFLPPHGWGDSTQIYTDKAQIFTDLEHKFTQIGRKLAQIYFFFFEREVREGERRPSGRPSF